MKESFPFVSAGDPCIVGVISDTHIPDRVDALHPELKSLLRRHKVELILHGGDISTLAVLEELRSVAPVLAVTGNRDFALRSEVPNEQRLTIFGTEIVLTHGHVNPQIYWTDKLEYIAAGYYFERYQKRLAALYPTAKVIVFGHTHHPENRWVGEQLYFNPGSVSHGDYLDRRSYYGLLKFYKSGKIEPEIIPLTGAQIRAKKWVNNDKVH